MKPLATSLFALLLSSPAFSATVVCQGENPHVNKIVFTLTVPEKGTPQATMVYSDLTDDHGSNPSDNHDFDPRDIEEASIGFQRLNFVFGHHNTVVKVSADGDIFGGASESDNEKDPFQGVLWYQTGNGNPSIDRFQLTCRQTN